MSYSSEVLADSPWAYYRLNDDPDGGVMLDSSGNGRHGVFASVDQYGYPMRYGELSSPGLTDGPNGAVEFGEGVVTPYGMQYHTGKGESPVVPTGGAFTVEGLTGTGPSSALDPSGGNGGLKIIRSGVFELSFGASGVYLSLFQWHTSFGVLTNFSGVNTTYATRAFPAAKHFMFTYSATGATGTVSYELTLDGASVVNTSHIVTSGATLLAFSDSVPLVITGNRMFADEVAYYTSALAATSRAPVRVSNLNRIVTASLPMRALTISSATMRVPNRIAANLTFRQMTTPDTTLRVPNAIAAPNFTLPSFTLSDTSLQAVSEPGRMNRAFLTKVRMISGIENAEVLNPVAVTPTVGVSLTDFEVSSVLTPRPIQPRVSVSCRLVTPEPTETTYRLRVVDIGGNRLAELENAVLKSIPVGKVTGITMFQFDLPSSDPKVVWCKEARYEVQVWRNDRLLWGGPIVRVNNNGKTVEVQCSDTNWYFTRRVVGRVPKKNLLVSEDGEPANYSGWKRAYLPRSEPETNPAMTTTMENTYSDRPSLRLSSSVGRTKVTFANDDWYDGTRLKAAAKADLREILDELTEFTNRPRIMVKVFDDDTGTRTASDERADARAEAVSDFILANYEQVKVVVESPAYRDPLNGNKTIAEREANRRTVLIYQSVDGVKGHKQHATQMVTLRNPSKKERKQAVSFTAYVFIEDEAGWAAGMRGVELVRSDPKQKHPDPKWAKAGYKKPLQTSSVLFGDGFPTGSWVRVTATVVLPNDGKRSQIEVRLFPPNGDALFSEMWLVRDQSLTFKRQEQADILTRLVEHAQSSYHGKTDLNIGTNIPKTGVKRTRSYPFDERATIYELLEEFPTLADGVEWQMVLTPETRTFTTYYPRMGKDTDVVLAYGSNAVSYGVGSDGTLLATTIVIQAPTGDDFTREERSVSDPTLMDGVVLEQVYDGTPNSPAASWGKQAERGLARYRRPISMPVLNMDPAFTDELLNTVSVGDRVLTNISDDAANVDDIQKCRVTEIYLDPKTDVLSYTLYPEDLNVVTLSSFGAPVKYLSQAQDPIVGASGRVPVQSNPEYAGRGFADGGWASGPAGVGWIKEASGAVLVNPSYTPATVVPDTHEVWIRKWVQCTGDMVLTLRAADWTYLYVNGHLVGNDHFEGYNRYQRAGTVNLRIPSSWLDPSGNQLVAVHSQFNPSIRSSDRMDSVYADVAVRGTYDPGSVT